MFPFPFNGLISHNSYSVFPIFAFQVSSSFPIIFSFTTFSSFFFSTCLPIILPFVCNHYLALLSVSMFLFLPVYKLKNNIIEAMVNVKISTLNEVTQICAIISMATKERDEISQDHQVLFKY